ncbi:uncharacterized protein LOC143547744 [Bidens hawaiensis]|uniref:uncharacterized protein LOC143547744 n=1 Tax=Bidens hawaiensis TaxID=980011 RepID=UPI004049687F
MLIIVWNTPGWLKRSKVGKNNRKDKEEGYLPRHTGGSMGFDERRINLEKSGKNGFSYVFVDTHATKECKERLSARDIDVNDLKELEFCTKRSRKSYVAYKKKLARLYDSDPSQHLTDDLDVWKSVQPKNRVGQMYGIGSSDPHFVVGRKPSTTCGLDHTLMPNSRKRYRCYY